MTHRRTPDAASLKALRTAVLKHIGAFLAGKETVFEFDEWLLEATWNVHLHSDPATRDLAGKVGLLLTEYEKGHRTDEELWYLLLDILAATPTRPEIVRGPRGESPIRFTNIQATVPAPAVVRKPLLAAPA